MAGAKVLETDIEGLGAVINEQQRLLDAAKSELNLLTQDIDDIDAAWEGDAHDTFMQTLRDDRDELMRIIRDLELFSEDMKLARQEYARAEEEIGALVDTVGL